MVCSPVVIFAYNRLDTLEQVVESLKSNKEAAHTDLIVISDGPPNLEQKINVSLVRDYLNSVTGFKSVEIIQRNTNYGLAKNIETGLNELFLRFKSLIVLEDDIVVNSCFLKFINDALSLYENNSAVSSVSGYGYLEKLDTQNMLPPTFFIKGADCLAFATWKNRWLYYNNNAEELYNNLENENLFFEFNRKNHYNFKEMLRRKINGQSNSWAINWYASNFLMNKFILFPKKSYARHIGNSNQATNYSVVSAIDPYDVELSGTKLDLCSQPVQELDYVGVAYNRFLKRTRGALYQRLRFKLVRNLKKFMRKIS